ncbi:MAG: PEGA domain-containing protein [Candidatus Omnitrophica bacterium]|nr:PEGA domain-containing protein [Candidatus Omnitrophota bacterium]
MDQKIRKILFYLSVILFFIFLPTVLLYSFGYKLDKSRFRFTKTGLIYVKTIPDGAQVYLNERRFKETTPATIEELLPGKYRLLLDLESYYPWQQIITVEPGKTTLLDGIVLFSKKPHSNKINIIDVDDFYITPEDKGYAYCVSGNRTTLSKVNLNPKAAETGFFYDGLELPANIKFLSLSPDKKKILYASGNKLNILYLPSAKESILETKNKNFSFAASDRIVDAFWYSDNEHVICVSAKDIKIYELMGKGKDNIVTLLELRDNRPKVFYDSDDDILYYTDLQEDADGRQHRGLYRLDITKRTFLPFLKEKE